MSNNDKKEWFLKRKKSYLNLYNMFSGLGTILIEGDSLINYLFTNAQINERGSDQANSKKLNKFLSKIQNEAGFNKIIIVFFSQYSKWTVNLENGLKLDDGCSFRLDDNNLKTSIRLFSNWTCLEWSNFVWNENICLVLSSVLDIFKEDYLKYEFIYHVINEAKLQSSLIDNLTFNNNFEINAFFISSEVVELIDGSNIESNLDPCQIQIDQIELNKNQISVANIYNLKLRDFLNLNSLQEVFNLDRDRSLQVMSKFIWENKLNYRRDNIKIKSELILKQRYYRYMESYSKALDNLKYLHSKIICNPYGHQKNVAKNPKTNKNEAEIIAKNKAEKLLAKENKDIKSLESLKISCFKDIDEQLKFLNVKEFSDKTNTNIKLLKIKWLKFERDENPDKKQNLFSFIIDVLENDYQNLEVDVIKNLIIDLKDLGFQSYSLFLRDKFLNKNKKVYENLKELNFKQNTFDHDVKFQLQYYGDKLKRSLDSEPDERVSFIPDKWQKNLLDIVDRNESALLCCPTSSGKTFISYYVMEKILKENHDDIVVFVSPTKALANQIAAEIYARFQKEYPKNKEKDIYAISMPDYIINDPFKCQILVTFSTSFESMLFDNNIEWQNKLRYVIFDEIQTLNEDDIGYSLEKIIHAVKCPIIAISATIGNLDSFFNWASSIQASKGIKMHKITHKERYCDLKKFIYKPRTNKSDSEIVPMHELFGYSKLDLIQNNLSEDFKLLPTEIIEILDALEKICTNSQKIELFESILPEKSNIFKCVSITKSDVKAYEIFLIKNLSEWFIKESFNYQEIEKFFNLINGDCDSTCEILDKTTINKNWLIENIFDLVNDLKNKNMLPAIIFMNSCKDCDQMAIKLVECLENQEKAHLDEKQLKKEENFEKKQEKLKKKNDKNSKSKEPEDDDDNYSNISSANKKSLLKLKYSFLDFKYKLTESEIDDEINGLKRKNIPEVMYEAWKKGIGVHHGNYHTKFRASVEYLIRRRHIQVAFATKELSLGINVPAKTVVLPFWINLNSITYRHMVGRAGRRGFDTIGNTVYYGIEKYRIKNYICSKVSNITGANSFDLNLFTQLSAMQTYNSYAYDILKSYIRNPLLKLSMPDYDENICKLHAHLQIQYLINRKIIDNHFNPIDFDFTNAILLLRNFNIETLILIHFIQSETFSNILNSANQDKIETAKLICLIICHFASTKFVTDNSNRYITLPDITELRHYLKSERTFLLDFVNSLSKSNDETNDSVIMKGFPFLKNLVNLQKSSYLYFYYCDGCLEKTLELFNLSESDIWYQLKDYRYISFAIKPIMNKKNDSIRKAFEFYSEKIDDLFFQIST